jgi:hypothetical protein
MIRHPSTLSIPGSTLLLCGLAAIVLLGSPGWAAEKAPYTLEELTALANQGSYRELLDHAEDVAPTKRDAAWRTLVEKAAVAHLEGAKQESDPFLGLLRAEELLKRYTFLAQSKAFLEIRRTVGLKGFEDCFDSDWAGGTCLEKLLGFVQRTPTNGPLAFDAAKLVMKKQVPYAAMPLFKIAISGAPDAAWCQDPDLYRCLFASLALPPDDGRAKDAIEIASGKCFGALKDELSGSLDQGGFLTGNLCAVLKKKGGLAGDAARKCP